MIKKIWKKISALKIRTQFALLILCALIAAFAVFEILWTNKFSIFNLLGLGEYYNVYGDNIYLLDTLYEQAPNYELPESEEDEERIQALAPLLDLADKYTSISIYGLEDGYHRTTRMADIFADKNIFFQVFLGIGDQLTAGDFADFRYIPLKFSNGSGSALIMSYKRSVVLYPYTFISLFLSILLFFLIILFFIRRKMKSVLKLKQEILVMSSGDLSHPVPHLGGDEIGILARELDNMRTTLNDNIEKEQESRQANQDLITALSHDLRTPLTILNGYLEVIKLKKNPGHEDEYLDRCLIKTKDIKELTDRMFEYALVFDEAADSARDLQLEEMPVSFFLDSLREHSDFLRLAGFQTNLCFTEPDGQNASPFSVIADKAMAKRVLNNLFSNIIKYADKKEAVFISASFEEFLLISVRNKIKQEEESYLHNQNHTSFASDALQESLYYPTGSTQIGLKSVRKMMKKMNGDLVLQIEDRIFTAKLQFSTKKPTL